MSIVPDLLMHLGGVPVANDPLFLAGGRWFFCDPTNGTTGGNATTPENANSDLEACMDLLRANHNDGIIFMGGATPYYPDAELAWDLDYTHFIGVSPPLSVGQRCRIVGKSATDLRNVLNVSGKGCSFKNLQIQNEGLANSTLSSAAIISGNRGYYENVFFAGMMVGPLPGTYASGYSLKVSGDEIVFANCAIGTAAQERLGANTELLVHGEANRLKFVGCDFQCWSNVAAKTLILIDATAVLYTMKFKDCLFNNLKSNNGAAGTALSNAISDLSTPYHQIILQGDNPLVGVTGYADTTTYIFSAAPQPNAGYGVAVVPTT